MAHGISDEGGAPGLVQCDPELHPVAEGAGDDLSEGGEPAGCFPLKPSTFVLEALGKLPVVKGDDWPDVVGEKRVDEPVVEPEPRFVDNRLAVRLHPVPGDGESVRANAQFCHERNVGLHSVVVVAGYVTRVAVACGAWAVAKCVPDRGRPAVLVNCPLDLVGRGRYTPKEALGKEELVCHGRVLSLEALLGRGHAPASLYAPTRTGASLAAVILATNTKA